MAFNFTKPPNLIFYSQLHFFSSLVVYCIIKRSQFTFCPCGKKPFHFFYLNVCRMFSSKVNYIFPPGCVQCVALWFCLAYTSFYLCPQDTSLEISPLKYSIATLVAFVNFPYQGQQLSKYWQFILFPSLELSSVLLLLVFILYFCFLRFSSAILI